MNKTYQGTVKTFNGQFGFLKSELGDTYFHKSGIVGKISIAKGDEVEFKTEPSQKKEGSLQACEITLIKKFEKPSIQLVNPILGILKWFNEEKGFGIIATPEKLDYFLHKSNIHSVNLFPKTGDVLVFEEKIEKGKKVASSCKAVRDYEDLKIALEYLFKEDNVIIEVKVAERGYRGKIHYSTQNKHISLLKQAVFQILKDKTIDVRLDYISDYFRDNLADKPSEEQLKYFNFIKTVFEINLKNDKTIILSSFFSRNIEFLRNHTELNYFLWLEGYTQEKDLSYIAEKIEKEPIDSYQNPFKKIFEKLTEPNEQYAVLKEFLGIIGSIDNEEKYKRIKFLSGLSELDEKAKEDYLISAYGQSDIERQYLMWLEGYTQEKDLSYIAEKIEKEPIDSYQNPFKKIFEKLTEPNEQDAVLKEFIGIIGSIDNEEKYKRIKFLSGLSGLDEKLQNNLKSLIESNIYHQVEQFLDYLQFSEGDNHERIISLFNNLDVISFYSFCLDLLNPLGKINTHYYNKGYSYLKIYLEKIEYIHETNKKYGSSSIFNYNGILLNERHFETKISFFRTISSYIESNLNIIEDNAKAIIETGDFDLISKFLKNFQSYNYINIQICSDLQIKESRIPAIESYVLNFCNTAQLLKFWVYGLIDYFDFNTYCYYYFTLSLEERKIFNKKAKAKMAEEIKASMLKKREPWHFVEKAVIQENQEIEIYTASWKSIWFGDGFIRFCMDSKPSFSHQFKWDFSEEKFNFLYEYISGKRLKELKITAKNDFIKSVEGLDELEELIWKILIIQEVETSNGTTIRGIGQNRIPVNMLLRNQCIQLLNNFQLKELEPTRVLEKTFNPINGGIGVDVSLLYSIPVNEYEIAIIWESLELEKAKATHIFKCLRKEYENIFSEIENYLSGTLKVRSSLNSKDADFISQQNKLRYLCRIEHDNFNFSKWEKSLYEILPELKSFILANG